MPTIGEILALRALALEPVTVPHPEAEVRWVTTSELPNPSQFLEGGEILLTTGLVERSSGDWQLFVERMLEAGVVGVGFGVGLSHPTVPRALSDTASAQGLNLFVVPRPVPFIAIGRAVAELLWAAERESDRLALQHQRDLTTAALRGTAHVLSALAAIISGSAVLCTSHGEVIDGHASSELMERARPLISRTAASGSRGASSEIAYGSRLAVHPVGVSGLPESYLVVQGDSPHRVAVTTALALLTLDRERARAERDADRRIRSGAMSLALRSDTDAARLLLAGAPLPVALPSTNGRVVRARGSMAELDDALIRLESAPGPAPLAAVLLGDLVAVIGDEEEERTAILALLAPLEIGIGPVRELAALTRSDEAARLALAAATIARPIVDWSELVDEGIDSLLDPSALASFATELLEPVDARDDGTDLIEALRAFLTHNGQMGPAAASLRVHRNTLRNRLDTAETVLGRSLHDPGLRADLWVALKSLTRRRESGPRTPVRR